MNIPLYNQSGYPDPTPRDALRRLGEPEGTYRLVIPGKLPGLNEYVSANRLMPKAGARMKRNTEVDLVKIIKSKLRGVKISKPVYITYIWYENNKRRDKDNISFAKKFIQDALVKAGTLEGDGWKHITGFEDRFAVDPGFARVEVIITVEGD